MKELSALLGLLLVFTMGVNAETDAPADTAAVGRVIITGTVFDKESGEPISDATVQAIETGFATKANSEGRYRLILPAGTYTFKASHVGHYSGTVHIELVRQTVNQDFTLQSSILDMGERKVYTRAYDPGQRIILEAIARKDDILSRIKDYEFDAYTRLVLTDETKPDSAESDVMLIAETQLKSYWEQPGRFKEVITSRRQTANLPPDANMVSVGEITNFNKNRIDINQYAIVSPTADDALEYYNYYLIDTVYLDTKPVFVLEIEPRNEFAPLFVGEIQIADSSYEVVSVDVGLSKGVSIPYIENARYYQQYAEINGKYWMPIEIGFIGDVHLGLGVFGIPSHIGFSYVAAISNYVIEEGIDKNTFDEFNLVIAPNADDFDSTVWASRIVLPLTAELERGYSYIDSVQHAPKPFLKRAERIALGATFMVLFGDRDIFHFNRVDGFYFGAPLTLSPAPEIRLHAVNGYGIQDDTWQYKYGIGYRLSMKRHVWFGGSIKNKNVVRRPITFIPELNETFGALIYGIDPNIYYREKGWEVHGSFKAVGKSWLRLGYNQFEYISQPRRTTYTPFGDRNDVQANMPITEGKKRSLTASLRFDSHPLINNKGRVETMYATNFIKGEVGVEYSSRDFAGSDFDFTRYFARVDGEFNPVGLGTTSIFCFAGATDGTLPAQSRFVAGYMDWGIYQTMGLITFPDTSFGGDRMAYLFAEHDFGKYMFRNSGIGFLQNIPIGFSIHGGAMWAEYGNGGFKPVDEVALPAHGAYTEIGFGLHNLTPWFGIINLSTKFSWQLSGYDTKKFNVSVNFFNF